MLLPLLLLLLCIRLFVEECKSSRTGTPFFVSWFRIHHGANCRPLAFQLATFPLFVPWEKFGTKIVCLAFDSRAIKAFSSCCWCLSTHNPRDLHGLPPRAHPQANPQCALDGRRRAFFRSPQKFPVLPVPRSCLLRLEAHCPCAAQCGK